MPRTSESAFNVVLGQVLRRKHPAWGGALASERTGVFRQAALQPDIVIRQPGGQPLVVETEFAPARSVEREAAGRLGLALADSGEPLAQAVALRVPADLRGDQQHLERRIEEAAFSFCVLSGSGEAPQRWPASGWVRAGIDDLAGCIERVALSEKLVNEGIEVLERGVRETAALLRADCDAARPHQCRRIARILRQEEGEQTLRMAMAIVANAFIFHTSIAGAYDIERPSALRAASGRLDLDRILACWARILRDINYWPIFRLASELLGQVGLPVAPGILERLADVASRLADIGTSTLSDLSGRMFQKLIADRKFLATFYTLPSSAALLAEMAVARLDVDWRDPAAIEDVCIADLACGTGALLGAAYQAVRSRHRRAGGDDARLHRAMMERSLVAADIMPAATHLAAALLSSAHPAVTFRNTRIYTLPYGEQPSDSARPPAIGSLELIRDEVTRALFGTGERVARGTGADMEAETLAIAHGSADVVIMNPPFTSPTNHESATVPVPSFAGFETTAREQREMSERLKAVRGYLETPPGTGKQAGHGNAGLASNFVDLAHAKVKPGGVVALVLPFAYAQGAAWANARRLLDRRYRDVAVVSIAASGAEDRAFSADTGMAEALVIGTKREGGPGAPGPTLFVNLFQRPGSLLDGYALARAVGGIPPGSRKGRLTVGDRDHVGSYIRVDGGLGCAGLVEPDIAEAMLALEDGALKLARAAGRFDLPLATLGEVGRRGLLHRDLSGRQGAGSATPRGPFDVVPIVGVPSYPALWRHDAERERRLVVAPDRQCIARQDCDERAAEAWQATASRLHLSLDFRLNSQSLAACLTEERSIGGRAWPNFRTRPEWEEAIALWANGTLGLATFWWRGSRQQQGRSILTISRVESLVALDPRQLGQERLVLARRLFDQFRARPFLPASEAYRDPVRKDLDRALLVDLLGLPATVLEPLDLFRRQWCAEPGVHGGKATRPPRAHAATP